MLEITNTTSEIISIGNPFFVEKWNGRSWMKLKSKTNRIFTDIGFELKPGDRRLLETDIFGYYPNLTKGKFRVSKYFFYNKDIPISPDESHIISIEMDID